MKARKDEIKPNKSQKRGRPVIQFDYKKVETHGKLGSTYEEMARDFNCTTRTIERRMAEGEESEEESLFCRAYKKGQAELHKSLRAKQIEMAMAGNVTMQIWLGKQMLGQRDKMHTESEIEMKNITPTINLIAKKPSGE